MGFTDAVRSLISFGLLDSSSYDFHDDLDAILSDIDFFKEEIEGRGFEKVKKLHSIHYTNCFDRKGDSFTYDFVKNWQEFLHDNYNGSSYRDLLRFVRGMHKAVAGTELTALSDPVLAHEIRKKNETLPYVLPSTRFEDDLCFQDGDFIMMAYSLDPGLKHIYFSEFREKETVADLGFLIYSRAKE